MGATELYVMVMEEELMRLTDHELGNWQFPEYREVTQILFQGEESDND